MVLVFLKMSQKAINHVYASREGGRAERDQRVSNDIQALLKLFLKFLLTVLQIKRLLNHLLLFNGCYESDILYNFTNFSKYF